jgi:hypothetical protein
VVGKIGKSDLDLSTFKANGSNEQPHPAMLFAKDMFDAGTSLSFAGVAAVNIVGHWSALGLLVMD